VKYGSPALFFCNPFIDCWCSWWVILSAKVAADVHSPISPGDSRIACEAEFEHYQQIEDAEREKKRKLKSEASPEMRQGAFIKQFCCGIFGRNSASKIRQSSIIDTIFMIYNYIPKYSIYIYIHVHLHLHCIISYDILLYCIILYYITLYCILLHCTILFYTIFYSILYYYIILYYSILYCIIWYVHVDFYVIWQFWLFRCELCLQSAWRSVRMLKQWPCLPTSGSGCARSRVHPT
jgi:hypothetical protein